MNERWIFWLSVSLWTISMIVFTCSLVLAYANGRATDLFGEGFGLFPLAAVSLTTVGVLLAIHRPGNPIGWIFLVSSLALNAQWIVENYAVYITETAPGALPEIAVLFWFGRWAWIVGIFLPPIFGILLFPTGRLPSRRWRFFVSVAAIGGCLWIVASMLKPGPLDSEGYPLSQFTNPIGVEAMSGVIDVILAFENLVAIVGVGGAVASIFVRLRSALRVERQQIKWFAYTATVPLAGVIVFVTIVTLPNASERIAYAAGGNTIALGLALLPVTIGIAILRHNLYDIDRLINRTLVYGSLTALLVLGFAGSILLFQLMLSPFTSGNDLAVAGSTLLTFALFRPLRGQLQSLVDRRFFRQKYDTERVLQAFGAMARDAVDLGILNNAVLAVVDETMQPASASLWLREPEAPR